MNRHASVIVSGVALALIVACTTTSDRPEAGATTAAAAGTLAEPNVGEIRSAIDAANQRSVAAMMAGDAAGAMGNYADDATVMMPMTATMNGRAAIEAGMKGMMDMMKFNDVKFTTTDVIAAGDLAIETGKYAMTTTMKGAKPVSDSGKYLTVWKRQADGNWKIIRDINNTDVAPGTPK